jgi:hypothetical protein
MLHPGLQRCCCFWLFRGERAQLWGIGLRKLRDRLQLLKSGSFVVAPYRPVREKIYRDQHA